MTIEESSLRDSLDAAFEKSETAEAPEAAEPAAVEPAPAEPKEPNLAEEVGKSVDKEQPKPPVKDEPSKTKSEDKALTDEAAPAPVKNRAPGSWKPAAREQWAALPPAIQQEVLRRERDIATGFNEVAAVKKFRDEFADIVGRNNHIIQAEGGDAMKLTRDLYTTAAALYNGSPQQKVMTVAGMIKNFGVDLRMLDNVLAGQQVAPQQGSSQQSAIEVIRREIQAALQPIVGQRTAEAEQTVMSDIEAFATDPKNEFFEDVKNDMADILELAAKRGQKMGLPEAYKRATMLHSEIADVIAERTLRSKAEQHTSVASQARKRAVSLRTTPSKELASGNVGEQQNSLGDDLRNAIDALSG